MHRRWAGLALGVTLVMVTGACELIEKQPPVPGRVAIGGDSLTVQASYWGGGLSGWDETEKIGIGWQAEHVQPRATLDVESPATSADVFVVALGQNDASKSAGRDGFTNEDKLQLSSLLGTPADGACVAVVEPWYQPPAGQPFDGAQMEGILAYRTWIEGVVASDPDRYRSVDWRPVAEAHPEYIAADGIHLVVPQTMSANQLIVAVDREQTAAVEAPAAVAYLDLLHAAASACED